MPEEIELRSARLLLRRLRADDAEAIATYRSRPEVTRYQSWDTYTAADAAKLIASQATVVPDTPGTWIQLALIAVDGDTVIGDCGIHFRADDPRQVELGITLSPDHQGRGLAAEALNCVLGYVFGRLNKHRAIALTDVRNSRAADLFRRAGFRQEGHFVDSAWYKGEWCSEFLFAMTALDWLAARANRGSREKFDAAMRQVADVEPDEQDRLP
ncbi:MAG: GNAT family N-acetyltransferase [Gemmataceae bacterium]|nr:GNAT family N-acetyltransferase [Gemmataceae bacterium]